MYLSTSTSFHHCVWSVFTLLSQELKLRRYFRTSSFLLSCHSIVFQILVLCFLAELEKAPCPHSCRRRSKQGRRSSSLIWEVALGVLTRTVSFTHHLPIMLTRTRSPTLMWPVPAPEGLLAVMAISVPHGVQLWGILLAASTEPAGNGTHVAQQLAGTTELIVWIEEQHLLY